MQKKTFILAITGASGAIYARKILGGLSTAGSRVYLVISPAGRRLLHDELGVEHPDPDDILGETIPHDIIPLPYNDIGACIASGSYKTNGMVVAPCSSNKLAEISRGLGDNLIGRAAQVTLKERRPLILLHREMPIGLIELRNMCQLAEAGAIICPASPMIWLPWSPDVCWIYWTYRIIGIRAGRVPVPAEIPTKFYNNV
jgi:4-hydroxy-3-polyprenylbenzoate decarboxylase